MCPLWKTLAKPRNLVGRFFLSILVEADDLLQRILSGWEKRSWYFLAIPNKRNFLIASEVGFHFPPSSWERLRRCTTIDETLYITIKKQSNIQSLPDSGKVEDVKIGWQIQISRCMEHHPLQLLRKRTSDNWTVSGGYCIGKWKEETTALGKQIVEFHQGVHICNFLWRKRNNNRQWGNSSIRTSALKCVRPFHFGKIKLH